MTTNAMHDPKLEKKCKSHYSNNWKNLNIDSIIIF